MPASMQGEMLPNIYRFKLGGFEVATIMDSYVIRPGLTPSFGGEAHAEEVKAVAAANRIEADRYFHPFTPTVVNTGKELVLFDTGIGARIEAGKATFEELELYMLRKGEPAPNASGRQEYLENLINEFI